MRNVRRRRLRHGGGLDRSVVDLLQLAKKAPQKTLKEQRAAKKAKKKSGGY